MARNLIRNSASSLFTIGDNTLYAIAPADAGFSVSSGSMGLWVKIANKQTQAGFNVRIFTVAVDGNHEIGFLMPSGTSGLGGDEVWYYGYDGAQKIDSKKVITKNVWHHLAMTFDASGSKYYLDGALVTISGTAASMVLGATPAAYFSRYVSAATSSFTGNIDEPFLYNTVLSATDIQNIYKNGIYPSAGKVALWLCDEGAGTPLADSSGNGHTAAVTGGNIFSPDTPFRSRLATRSMPKCVQFASGAYIDIDDAAAGSFSTGSFSAEVWFNRKSAASGSIINGFSANSDGNRGFIMQISGYQLLCSLDSSATQLTSVAGSILPDTWVHAVLVRDGDVATLYINGVANVTTTGQSAKNVTSSVPVEIGRQPTGADPFTGGQVAFMRLYSRALTAAEVLARYRSDSALDSLRVEYKFTEGSGTSVADTSGNANTGIFSSSNVSWQNTGGPFTTRPAVT